MEHVSVNKLSSTDRALIELSIAGFPFNIDPEEDPESVTIEQMIGRDVAQLLEVFRSQGHSGASASIVAGLFHRLVKGEVLTPLTGRPEEWMDVSEMYGQPMFQNKRCFAVFADDENGKNAYNVQGRIFVNKNGTAFSASKVSSTPLTFPCMPITEYIREGTPEAEEFKDVFKDTEAASARAQKK